MFFTQEDYIKIQQWLIKNSVKDTEFNEANIPFNGEETITIVQGNQNKKVFLKDLIAQVFNLGISDFVNITDKYDAPNISLEEAIRLIPSRARKEGQVITFLDREDHWHIYQFKGVLNQWNVLDTWEDLFDFNINNFIIDSILPDEEDLTKSEPDTNGNSYLSLKDREYNPEDFSGLGRIILRKNIMEVEDPIYGKVKNNILYQDMINKSNTIYEIRYDFDLNGAEITIPEGCVLDFQGGSLSNGKIVGNKTKISSNGANIFNADNISLDGTYLNNIFNLSWFYSIEDESAIHKAIVVIPLNKTLLCNQEEIYLKKELTVNRGIDLDFSKTKIYLENDASITFNKVSKRRFKFDTITGNGLNTIGLNLKGCSFCTFDFQEITDCLYGIVFNFDGVNGESIGQNIFRYVLIYRCNIGIYFKGANEWSNNVVWAEGNEFFGGFIAKCYNSGIKLEDNIKCGNSIFIGAVDCIEAGENAYDIIDETNETSYAQKNIYISNFIRVAKCKFRKRDLILSTEYGIQSYAAIKSNDGIQTGNSNGSVILSGGTMEMYNPSGPFIDLKRIDTDDREWRISGGDKYVVSPKDAHGFELDKDNEFSVPIKGRYEVAAGETTATISFPSIKPSSDYILIITPYFNTNYYVQNKSQHGAVIKFSTAPTKDSYIEYVVFGL